MCVCEGNRFVQSCRWRQCVQRSLSSFSGRGTSPPSRGVLRGGGGGGVCTLEQDVPWNLKDTHLLHFLSMLCSEACDNVSLHWFEDIGHHVEWILTDEMRWDEMMQYRLDFSASQIFSVWINWSHPHLSVLSVCHLSLPCYRAFRFAHVRPSIHFLRCLYCVRLLGAGAYPRMH